MNWINFLVGHEDIPVFSTETTLQKALDGIVDIRHKTGIFLDDGKVVGIITERDIIRSFISGISSDEKAFEYCTKNVVTIHQSRSIEYALGTVISKNLKRVPVVDDDDRYVGLLTQDALLSYFEIKNDNTKQKAVNLIQGKSLITAKSSDSLSVIAATMYKNKIGLLPLVKAKKVVGTISEVDILQLIKKSVSFDDAAELYMTADVLFVEENSYSDDILELMDARGVNHVLVLGQDGGAIGALSKRDLIRNLKDNYQKVLEKKLKNARDALSLLPNPVVELSKSDNSYYVSWHNSKAEEAVGSMLFDFRITDIIKDDKFAVALSECASSGENQSCIVTLLDRSYEVMCYKLDDSSLQLLFNDLTEIKKSEEYLRSVIDFLPELIVVSDGAHMLSCNKSVLDFFGFNSFDEFKKSYKCICEAFVNTPDYLVYDENSGWLQEAVKNTENGTESLAKIFDTRNAKELIFSVKAASFMQSKAEFLVTFFDVTESKKQKMMLEEKNRELEELASIDSLTGVYNRNKLREIAMYEFRKQKRDKKPLSLVMLDIDYFKKINDTYGHNVGDYALKTISKLVAQCIRESDAFARWGGEEFVILTPGADVDSAAVLAEKLRQKIANFEFENIGSITCSFGVAQISDGFELENLVENADKALYMAKRSGRNRTEIYLA